MYLIFHVVTIYHTNIMPGVESCMQWESEALDLVHGFDDLIELICSVESMFVPPVRSSAPSHAILVSTCQQSCLQRLEHVALPQALLTRAHPPRLVCYRTYTLAIETKNMYKTHCFLGISFKYGDRPSYFDDHLKQSGLDSGFARVHEKWQGKS